MIGPPTRGLDLALAILLAGCASAGGNASGKADAAVPCETDFSRLATAERVSLRDDVLPIFGLNCAMSSCHGGDAPAAKLYLGVRCVYDESSPHRCTFPDSPPQSPPDAMPLTPEIVDRVYQDLLVASGTAPNVPRVTPGDPDTSFLVDKIGGTHNNRGYDCVSSSSAEFGPCGAAMPFGSSGFCQFDGFGASSFNTIAAWVLQGARNE
jgi:hypothetical protein